MRNNRSVAITGMGVVSSIGQDITSFAAALQTGKSGIGYLQRNIDLDIPVKIGAEIRGFTLENKKGTIHPRMERIINKIQKCVRRSPEPLHYAVAAAIEAWESSGICDVDFDMERVGLVVAGNNLNQHLQYDLYEKFKKNPEFVSSSYALQFMDTDHVGTLSELFGINGEGFTVGGASASGNVGIIKGLQLIRLGIVDVCVVVGAAAVFSPMELQAFYNIGAMGGKIYHDRPEQSCRPFDIDHEGFIYGQASGCIILESMESANARKTKILAEILGSSIILDGNKLSDPNVHGEERAMASALKQANIRIGEIDYINTHGSSSPLGDRTELKAISKICGNEKERIWINSTKSLTGHCLYSAGVIEAIATVLQLNGGFVHPNLNLERPIDETFRFSKETYNDVSIKVALSNSFAFGGINTSLIIRKGEY
ncbi:beta-ketoacyl synthase N-terminal-like domain-containing protein [Paenibacillus sp. chi10]|uniref:Beta-ketoacyl synthase N-terminal-like domain-containing protein n=2 Tax=Paenibacillus TaxID=44249 RepID=A0AAJ2JYR0_9BACL|nr:beta-ketoacyl synthase N-terminal-like domain-containing protein [Paenibacillus sp. chi10]MDT8977360.1 beta-ketoacyl synthase N-terminal-like domain-containing protein [Paenibacillus sp. chi10]